MTLLETIARFDKYFRPLALLLSPKFAIDIYSRGRHEFIKSLSKEKIHNPRYVNKGEPSYFAVSNSAIACLMPQVCSKAVSVTT